MSDCINYYFIRDVDNISEHVFRIHNVEREKEEREREREPLNNLNVKKANVYSPPKKKKKKSSEKSYHVIVFNL